MLKVTINKQKFQRFRIFGNQVLVHINEQEDGDFISCDELMIPCYDRDIIISSLIKANYPADRMDAIRNNYELVKDGTAGDKADEYTEEYNKMQAWRAYSKELASIIMENKDASNVN